MRIDIIGAGIGGLTIATALRKKGFQTQVYEQAKELRPIGAGIILANNAMQVFEKLGLKNVIEASGNAISSINITTPNLKPISKFDLGYFEEKYTVKNIAIHRGKLQQILIDELDSSTIKLDFELTQILQKKENYLLKFKNKKEISSQIIIGADGINSKVRNDIFINHKVRKARQVCWRGITSFQLPSTYQNELNEAWGEGNRFGFVQIEPNKVYWYALKKMADIKLDYFIDEIGPYFNSYDPMIKEIIQSTPKQNIHAAEITDLSPMKKWYEGNVCLIGDAAHATTPNLGQGACQAIEDAYVLSECLDKYDLEKAFVEFQRLRISKAHYVVNTSWTLGKIAHWTNPLAIKIRNQIMKMTPNSLNKKQTEKLFEPSVFV